MDSIVDIRKNTCMTCSHAKQIKPRHVKCRKSGCKGVYFDAKYRHQGCPIGKWGELPVKQPLALVVQVGDTYMSSHCEHYVGVTISSGRCAIGVSEDITIAKCIKNCKNRVERKGES